jgi:hypothetical protein
MHAYDAHMHMYVYDGLHASAPWNYSNVRSHVAFRSEIREIRDHNNQSWRMDLVDRGLRFFS